MTLVYGYILHWPLGEKITCTCLVLNWHGAVVYPHPLFLGHVGVLAYLDTGGHVGTVGRHLHVQGVDTRLRLQQGEVEPWFERRLLVLVESDQLLQPK